MKKSLLWGALCPVMSLLAAPSFGAPGRGATSPRTSTPVLVKPPVAAASKPQPKAAPKTVSPKLAVPKPTAPKTIAPKAAQPNTLPSNAIPGKTVAPKVVAPKVVAPKVVAPKVVAPKVVAPKVVAPKIVSTPMVAAKSNSAKTMAISSAPISTLEKLQNGVQFVTRIDKLAPRAAISLVIRTGAAEETPQTAGWRRLLVGAMLRGAPQGFGDDGASLVATPQNEGLPRAAEKLGGTIGMSVGDDFIEIYTVGDSKRAPELLDLALALWQRPRLSPEDLNAARESSQNQIDAGDLDTASKTQAALRGQLFRDARGELSAYGLPDYGTEASLANLTDEKLRALQQTRFANARLTVAASGDFDAAALREKLKNLPARAGREPATPFFAAPQSTPSLVVRELPIPSAWVFVSYPLAGNTKVEAPALRVLAAALGDSGAARLPARLLKNQPMGASTLASSVAAQFIPRRYAGELVIFAQTGPQNVERVKNALLDEIRRLRDVPLSKSELSSAKTYARGSWSLERQSGRERAFQTALSPALGGPLDTAFPARLQGVTSAQVQAAARKYLKSYAVALVMPGE